LPPNESVEITITFLPDTAIAYEGMITVMSNDPTNRRTMIPFSGTGILPETDVDWTRHDIIEDYGDVLDLRSADIDGDGDIDLVGASINTADISWFENDGEQNFEKHTIADDFGGASSVFVIDLDEDGDIDVVGTANTDDELAWWENDGDENFEKHTVSDNFDGVYEVDVRDFDSDGDLDMVCLSFIGGLINWWENDGEENFESHLISDEFNRYHDVFIIDLDGDEDFDVIAGSGNTIFWCENDGEMNFGDALIVDQDFVTSKGIFAVDLDNDDDIDILGTSEISDQICLWYNDGEQNWTKSILRENFENPWGVSACDLDLDNDVDIIAPALGGGYIQWWENIDGEHYIERVVENDFRSRNSPFPDLDLDGDNDIIGFSSDGISWWENGLDPVIPNIAVEPEALYFGNVWVDESEQLTLTISNEGDEDLIIFEITVENEAFTTSFEEQVSIRSDESIDITVTFTPDEHAEFDTDLIIASNDPRDADLRVPLRGTGISNNPPIVPNPIDSQEADEDFDRYVVADLDTVFSDPDEDELEYTAESNNENLIVEIDDANRLWLSAVEHWFGEAEVTVWADDGYNPERDQGPVRSLRSTAKYDMADKNVCPTGIVSASDISVRQLRTAGRSNISVSQNIDSGREDTSVRQLRTAGSSNTSARTLRSTGSADNLSRQFVNPVHRLDPRRDDSVDTDFNVTIRSVNDLPVWDDVPEEVIVNEGEEIEFTVTASDVDGDELRLAANSEDLPEGWEFNDHGNDTGTFTWQTTDEEEGEYVVRFGVTDTGIDPVYAETQIIVTNYERPEWTIVPEPITVSEGSLIEFTVEGTGSVLEDLSITYSSDDLPDDVHFTDNGEGNGSFDWQTNHNDEGEYIATFMLSDGESEVEAEVRITVEEDNILNVPDEYETIQGAIDVSADGDTVLVEPGEYVEN
ncbi:MAG: VCBS repeat-containing protein, partial [Calditrichaeota bacterium]|nr:VCBS repeat-containing protein [Calditrichota bacterium]